MEFPDATDDLVRFCEWEGAVQKRVDLNELFEIDPSQTVSFEIAFTAFLATVILGTVPTGTDLFVPWVAGGLLLTTLVRKMAHDNVFADEDRVFRQTLTLIFSLTVFAVLYLSLSGLLSPVLGLDPYLVTAVILVVVTYGTLLAYEYVFQDFMFWGAIRLYNQAVDGLLALGTPSASCCYSGPGSSSNSHWGTIHLTTTSSDEFAK